MEEWRYDWTRSQRAAFPYIQRAVREGLTASGALSEYRAGGGAIRDAFWYDLYRQEREQYAAEARIERVPEYYVLPESFFEPVPFDWRQRYVMRMEVEGWSYELGQTIRKWVTVESDDLLTMAEWEAGAQDAITGTIGSPEFVIENVIQYDAKMRMD